MRIGSIFHLIKLWKAKFFILCDLIFLVRLQRKYEIDHSWEWNPLMLGCGVVRIERGKTATMDTTFLGYKYKCARFHLHYHPEVYFCHLQIEGMAHVSLYVQAHSEIVLILLADPDLKSDQETIRALVGWTHAYIRLLRKLEPTLYRPLGACTEPCEKPVGSPL